MPQSEYQLIWCLPPDGKCSHAAPQVESTKLIKITHIMLWTFFFTGMCSSLQNASEAAAIKISWTRKVSTDHFGRISGCAQAQPEPRPSKWLSVLLRPWHGHLPFRPSPQQPFRPTHYAYIIKQSHKNKEINTKSFSNLLLWLAARSLRTSKSSQYCHLH